MCPTSDIHFKIYLLGKIEWLGDFLTELWLQAQGASEPSKQSFSTTRRKVGQTLQLKSSGTLPLMKVLLLLFTDSTP